MQDLIHQALADARNYPDYRAYLTQLLAAGKTTGPNQSDSYVQFAQLNQARMDRLDKRDRFLPAMIELLNQLSKPVLMLVITEGWCGDAAQIIPLLYHMTKASDQLDLQLVLRDEHPGLMDHFLTNEARSIPKVIFLDPATKKVLGDWGPRPAVAQQMTMDYKHLPEPKPSYDTYQKELHTWYARDKTASTQLELVAAIKDIFIPA
ncbi:MAG: thioredoxin family protein [Lewinella sp.]